MFSARTTISRNLSASVPVMCPNVLRNVRPVSASLRSREISNWCLSVSPVWFRWLDGAFEVVIAESDRKLRHLEREGRPLEGIVAIGPAVRVSRRSRLGVPVGVRANLELALSADRFHVVHGHEPGLPSLSYLALRRSKTFEESKKRYPPGWGAHDLFADPKCEQLTEDKPLDVRLREGSPALDAGVELPAEWPDPLRPLDRGKPDVGALPLGAPPLTVGLTAVPAKR